DSLTALELRNALAQHTGLTLSPALIFDHPTLGALAHHLLTQLTTTNPVASPVRTTITAGADEPIAVVGMACRFPGGIDSAAGLWQVVSG
ncbi:hypothetical protein BST12_29980, partial [Mycobacterium angelicum]